MTRTRRRSVARARAGGGAVSLVLVAALTSASPPANAGSHPTREIGLVIEGGSGWGDWSVRSCTDNGGDPFSWPCESEVFGTDAFEIQKDAIARAVMDPVLVPRDGTVAITVVQASAADASQDWISGPILEVPYTVIDDRTSAAAVAGQIRTIQKARRTAPCEPATHAQCSRSRGTLPGRGIDMAMNELAGKGDARANQEICLAGEVGWGYWGFWFVGTSPPSGLPENALPVPDAVAQAQSLAPHLDAFRVLNVEVPPFVSVYLPGAAAAGRWRPPRVAFEPLVFGPGGSRDGFFTTHDVYDYAEAFGPACLGRPAELLALEAVQSVQSGKDDVPLVEGKATVVRAHVRSKDERGMNVTARLQGFRDGEELPGSPLLPDNPGGRTYLHPNDAPLEQLRWDANGLHWQLPDDWLSGTVRLRVVEGGFECKDVADEARDCAVTVSFEETATPKVKFLGSRWTDAAGDEHTAGESDARAAAARIEGLFPVAGMDAPYRGRLDLGSALVTEDEFRRTLTAVDTIRYMDDVYAWAPCTTGGRPVAECQREAGYHYLALAGGYREASAAGAWARGLGQVALGEPDDRTASVAFTEDDPYGSVYLTAGHELGHALGRPHAAACGAEASDFYPPEDFPFGFVMDGEKKAAIGPMDGDANRRIYGWDALHPDDPVRGPESFFELMSGCDPRWISSHTYTRLMPAIRSRFSSPPDAPSVGALPEWLVVTFALAPGGADAVRAWVLSCDVTCPDPPRLPPGDYTLAVSDEHGDLVASIPFTPPPAASPQAASAAGTPVIIAVPRDPRIARVSVSRDGTEIGSATASANAPAVSIVSPNGGEDLSAETVTVRWTSSDADGDDVAFMVQYSADGGVRWETLAAAHTGTELTVPRSVLGGSASGRFRVQASDGLRVAVDDSEGAVRVANNAPAVDVSAPAAGHAYTGGQRLVLDADARDPEDGALQGDAVVWRSDRDGVIARGPRASVSARQLTAGRHVLTVAATDAAGAESTDTVEIDVARRPPAPPEAPDLVPELEAPDTLTAGDRSAVELRATNIGSGAATGTVEIRAHLSGDARVGAASGPGWSCSASGRSATCARDAGELESGGTLPTIALSVDPAPLRPGADDALAPIDVRVVAEGDADPANDRLRTALRITPGPNLAVAAADSGPFSAGETGTYTITVSNAGRHTAGGRVTLTTVLPEGLDARRAVVTDWTCGIEGRSFSCTYLGGEVAPGADLPPIRLDVAVDDAAPTPVTTTFRVRMPGDADPDDDAWTVLTDVHGAHAEPADRFAPDLAVRATHGQDPLSAGGGGRLDLRVWNAGKGPAGGPVVLTDTLPAGLEAVAASGAGWSCRVGVPAAGRVRCVHPGAELDAGATLPDVHVHVRVQPRPAASVTNAATVTTPGDPNADNDTATDPVSITTATFGEDLAIDGTLPPVLRVGESAAYSAVVRNAGTAATTAPISVRLVLNIATNQQVSGDGWTCPSSVSLGIVECTRPGSLAPGEAAPPLQGRATPGARSDGMAFFNLDVSGPNASNNVLNLTVPVREGAYAGVLATCRNSGDGGGADIYALRRSGVGAHRLTTTPGHDCDPAWAPSGRKIAYTHTDPSIGCCIHYKPDIFVMNPDGSGATRLTSDPADDTNPAWSPDGSLIAFQSARNGNPNIYVIGADGTGERRLTSGPESYDLHPTWSPDGREIAFSRSGEIWIAKADGPGERRLTDTPDIYESDPAWSHDGRHIAFYDSNGLYTMPATGGDARRLSTCCSFTGGDPEWSPDDTLIASGTGPIIIVSPAAGDEVAIGGDGTSSRQFARPSWGPSNIPPEAAADAGTTPRGVPLVVPVLANDTDADGDALAVIATGAPGRGSASCDRAGACTYTPSGRFTGWDVFTYTVSDGRGGFDTGTARVEVTGVAPSIDILSPADGSAVPVPPGSVAVSGRAAGESLPAPRAVQFIVDSASPGLSGDCDGDGTPFGPGDDLNGDGRRGGSDDCMVTSVATLVRDLDEGADVGVIAFSQSATRADVDPADGAQTVTMPLADRNANAVLDIDEVARSIDDRRVNTFTPYTQTCCAANLDAALTAMNDAFAAEPADRRRVAYLLSDGFRLGNFTPTVILSRGPGTPLQRAIDEGVVVHVLTAVPYDAASDRFPGDPPGATRWGGCRTDSHLRVVSDLTGGTCNEVRDPAMVAADGPGGLSAVEVRLREDPPVLGRPGADGSWSAPLSGVTPGVNPITATARTWDGERASDSIDVVGTVPANSGPAAADDAIDATAGAPATVGVLANDADPDGDRLVVSSSTDAAHGTAVCVSYGECTYTAQDGFAGADAFTYTVRDGRGGTAAATVRVAVRAPNRPPVAGAASATTPKGTPVTIDVLARASDPDGDALAVSASSDGAHGTAGCPGTGRCTYRPAAGFSGIDTFSFTVSDGRGGTATGRAVVDVRPAPDASVTLVALGSFIAGEQGTLRADVRIDGDPSHDVAVGAELPGGLRPADAFGEGWRCTTEDRTVSCLTSGPFDAGALLPPLYLRPDVLRGPEALVTVRVATLGDPHAANDVASVTVPVRTRTDLRADALVARVGTGVEPPSLRLGAILLERAEGSAPVADRTVRFLVGGVEACRAVTDARGRASCGGATEWTQALLALGFEAVFDGDTAYFATSDRAPLVDVAGNRVL